MCCSVHAKRLSREESGRIKMARNASAIVSEILNNVSAFSSVLDNSQNLASTSTTSNTTVEGVGRLFLSTRKFLRKRYEPIDFSSTADKPTRSKSDNVS